VFLKKLVFLPKTNGYQKCDVNRNVSKMGVIVMGVYCIFHLFLNIITSIL
jgi:hypothetical protein